MKSKIIAAEDVQKLFRNEMTIMIAGFSRTIGVPQTLIQSLLDSGVSNLNIISSNASGPDCGIGLLVRENRIRHLTCSHIGNNREAIAKYTSGELDITFIPLGTLCEQIRAGGAGLGGILTPVGVGTPVAEGKRMIEVGGKQYLLELPFHADIALIHAWKADTCGNLVYRLTARNFNPIMAMAADHVIAEAEEIVDVGELDPNEIITPGSLIDAVIQAQ